MAGACTGLKVLEISRGMAGALAGMVLADHGADLIRLEHPSGDPHLSQAGERLWSRGKRRLALDLNLEADRESALALAREADVVLCALRPTTVERWGLTYPALSAANPRLIFASISGFGWTGPYRDLPATEGMVQALSGSMNMPANGGHRDGPVLLAPPLASYGAALTCVQGIVAALRERDASGLGQHVDASLYGGLLVNRAYILWAPERHAEDFPLLSATAPDHRGVRPLFNLNECSDGRWLSMAAWTPALAYKALQIMGLMDVLADERFVGLPNFFPQPSDRNELLNLLWDAFKTHPLNYWLELMDAHAIPAEPAQTVEEFRGLGQLWANGLAVEVDDPVVGKMVQPGVIGELSETPGEVQPAEATARPASEAAALRQAWRAAPAAARAKPALPPNPRGPLAGVRVLDFTMFLSGPMCAHLLSDLGASVTKVEPHAGDDFRMSAPFAFRKLQRDKKSVVVDLKGPGGDDILERLVRESDVIVYNYRLGVEERLGLSYERLKAINDKIIVCRITAFGPRGERAHRGGYDASITALSGISAMQSGEGNAPVSITVADISTGLAAATAVTMAIRARETRGVGQQIDIAMIGAMAHVGADTFAGYQGKPAGTVLDRGQHGFGPGYRLYRSADGWVFVAAIGPAAEAALGSAIGQTGPLDAAAAEPAFADRSTAEWLATLSAAGVPAADAVVNASAFLHETPAFRANATRIAVETERYGSLGQGGPAILFSRTPARVEHQEPELGEHTEQVLRTLGISEDELDALRAAGTVLAPRSTLG